MCKEEKIPSCISFRKCVRNFSRSRLHYLCCSYLPTKSQRMCFLQARGGVLTSAGAPKAEVLPLPVVEWNVPCALLTPAWQNGSVRSRWWLNGVQTQTWFLSLSFCMELHPRPHSLINLSQFSMELSTDTTLCRSLWEWNRVWNKGGTGYFLLFCCCFFFCGKQKNF